MAREKLACQEGIAAVYGPLQRFYHPVCIHALELGHRKNDKTTNDSSTNGTVKMTCSYAEEIQISGHGLLELSQ